MSGAPWRCSVDDAFDSDEPPIIDRGGGLYCEARGGRSGVAYHEAGHVVAGWLLFGGASGIVLRQECIKGESGDCCVNFSGYAGTWSPDGGRLEREKRQGRFIPDAPPQKGAEWAPWHFGVKGAIFICAGLAAEWKFKTIHSFSRHGKSAAASDRIDLAAKAAVARNVSGCNSQAYRRFAWRKAQLLFDRAEVWRATDLLANEALSGMGHTPPADFKPGDMREFVMPSRSVEGLLRNLLPVESTLREQCGA